MHSSFVLLAFGGNGVRHDAHESVPADGLSLALHELAALMGERLSTASGVTAQYACGESFAEAYPPDAVAFPSSTEEVSEIAKICHLVEPAQVSMESAW